MKVKCKFNSIDENEICSFQKLDSSNGKIFFPLLEKDKIYLVMGLIFAYDGLAYLIDSFGSPFDCPYQLFEIVDNNLPIDWKLQIFINSSYYNGIVSICGYKELVEDEKHFLNLFESEFDTIYTYFKRKTDYEKYLKDLEYS
jgi:hypothetical protein